MFIVSSRWSQQRLGIAIGAYCQSSVFMSRSRDDDKKDISDKMRFFCGFMVIIIHCVITKTTGCYHTVISVYSFVEGGSSNYIYIG